MINFGKLQRHSHNVFLVGVLLFTIIVAIKFQGKYEDVLLVGEQISELREQDRTRSMLILNLQAIDQTASMDSLLFFGATAELASAALLGRANRIVEEAGGEIRSASISRQEMEAPFLKIGAEVSFVSENQALHDILLQISSEKPMITVERLIIESRSFDEMHPPLKATMKVIGLARLTEQ